MTYYYFTNELYHHGIKGQRWGVRRYQNEDGTLTPAGKKRYGTVENFEKSQAKKKKIAKNIAKGAAIAASGAYLTHVILSKIKQEKNIARMKANDHFAFDLSKALSKTMADFQEKDLDTFRKNMDHINQARKVYGDDRRTNRKEETAWDRILQAHRKDTSFEPEEYESFKKYRGF